MSTVFKRLIRRFFIACTILLVIAYVLTCFIPFLPAGKYWPIAVLGLGFSFMLLMLIVFLFGWLIARSRWALLPLIALLISWQQVAVFFAFHKQSVPKTLKPDKSIRILTWNVSSWDEYDKHKRGGQSYRTDMMDLIRWQDADVLCLQEFFEYESSKYYKPNIPAVMAMGFKYYYFVPHYFRYDGAYKMGVVIFSKYPITDTAVVQYKKNSAADNLIYADINVGGRIIRIMTTHLQSVRFNSGDYEGMNQIKNTEGNPVAASKTILSKVIRAYRYRSAQADEVRQAIDKSPHPVIVCGDFNDVPNSYTYFTIKGDLTDAFLEKGSGIGKTLRFLGPTLRIDYILTDKKFTIWQFRKFNVPYSDHYPIMADIVPW